MSRRASRLRVALIEGSVIDQTAWSADILHDPVTRINAQSAGDAADLLAFANINAGGAHRHTFAAVDAIAVFLRVFLRFLEASALLPAPILVGNDERFFIEHRPLDARPRAHVNANLLAHEPAQPEGGAGENCHRHIGNRVRVQGEEVAKQGGRIGKVENPGPAGHHRDQKIDCPLAAAPDDFRCGPRRLVEPHPGVAVTVDETVDMLEKIGPHRLRTGITAPCAAHSRSDEKQADTGHDEQTRHEVEFMRPDLDVEHVKAAVGKIDQHRLIGRIWATVPPDPRGHVIDRQCHDHDRPFEPAKRSVDPLVVDLLARFVELGSRLRWGVTLCCGEGLCLAGIQRSAPIAAHWLVIASLFEIVRSCHSLRFLTPRLRHRSRDRARLLAWPRLHIHHHRASAHRPRAS